MRRLEWRSETLRSRISVLVSVTAEIPSSIRTFSQASSRKKRKKPTSRIKTTAGKKTLNRIMSRDSLSLEHFGIFRTTDKETKPSELSSREHLQSDHEI